MCKLSKQIRSYSLLYIFLSFNVGHFHGKKSHWASHTILSHDDDEVGEYGRTRRAQNKALSSRVKLSTRSFVSVPSFSCAFVSLLFAMIAVPTLLRPPIVESWRVNAAVG